MRAATITIIALVGCSSKAAQSLGLNQYTVTAPSNRVFATANEICARLGRMATSVSIQVETNAEYPKYTQIKFECLSAYEIVPLGKNSYKIWVPTSEIPVTDACEACSPPQNKRLPDLTAGFSHAKQRASEYCSKSNGTIVQTGGGFDMGTGLNIIFSCVP